MLTLAVLDAPEQADTEHALGETRLGGEAAAGLGIRRAGIGDAVIEQADVPGGHGQKTPRVFLQLARDAHIGIHVAIQEAVEDIELGPRDGHLAGIYQAHRPPRETPRQHRQWQVLAPVHVNDIHARLIDEPCQATRRQQRQVAVTHPQVLGLYARLAQALIKPRARAHHHHRLGAAGGQVTRHLVDIELQAAVAVGETEFENLHIGFQ